MTNVNPEQIASDLHANAEIFEQLSGRKKELIKAEAEFKREVGKSVKVEAKIRRMWEQTDEGIQQAMLEVDMKSLLTTMSAQKKYLQVLSDQSHNLY